MTIMHPPATAAADLQSRAAAAGCWSLPLPHVHSQASPPSTADTRASTVTAPPSLSRIPVARLASRNIVTSLLAVFLLLVPAPATALNTTALADACAAHCEAVHGSDGSAAVVACEDACNTALAIESCDAECGVAPSPCQTGCLYGNCSAPCSVPCSAVPECDPLAVNTNSTTPQPGPGDAKYLLGLSHAAFGYIGIGAFALCVIVLVTGVLCYRCSTRSKRPARSALDLTWDLAEGESTSGRQAFPMVSVAELQDQYRREDATSLVPSEHSAILHGTTSRGAKARGSSRRRLLDTDRGQSEYDLCTFAAGSEVEYASLDMVSDPLPSIEALRGAKRSSIKYAQVDHERTAARAAEQARKVSETLSLPAPAGNVPPPKPPRRRTAGSQAPLALAAPVTLPAPAPSGASHAQSSAPAGSLPTPAVAVGPAAASAALHGAVAISQPPPPPLPPSLPPQAVTSSQAHAQPSPTLRRAHKAVPFTAAQSAQRVAENDGHQDGLDAVDFVRASRRHRISSSLIRDKSLPFVVDGEAPLIRDATATGMISASSLVSAVDASLTRSASQRSRSERR